MKFCTARLVTASMLLASLPLTATAASLWHQGYGEESLIYQPDHVAQTRTRADVVAEVRSAQQDGSIRRVFSGVPDHGKPAPGPSREAVIKEMMQESPVKRALRLREDYSGG